MERIIILLFTLLIPVISFAQPFGNEWINYQQKYFKFKIVESGIYRIYYQTLNNAGVPLATVNPKSIQLFAKEKELSIRIEGEEDGVFNEGDYIEFIGEGNDGWLDGEMYDSPSHQNNPYHSLYNDTLTYFLTWNGKINNKRIIDESFASTDNLSPIPYCIHKTVYQETNRYLPGKRVSDLSHSFITEAEGWFGNPSRASSNGAIVNKDISVAQAFLGVGTPSIKVTDVSASLNNPPLIPGTGFNHNLQVLYGKNQTLIIDTLFRGYQLNRFSFEVPASEINADKLRITHKLIDPNNIGLQSLSFISLEYPHTFNFEGKDFFRYKIPYNTKQSKSLIEIENYQGSDAWILKIDNFTKRIPTKLVNGKLQAVIENEGPNLPIECLFYTNSSVRIINKIEPVTFSGFFTDFKNTILDSAFIIITHNSLLHQATNYAAYKSLKGFNSLVINVDEMYDQFSGGIPKNPIGIRRFLDMAVHTWNSPPSYLFLIGKSIKNAIESSNDGRRYNETHYRNCLVPSIGQPSSDIFFSAGLDGQYGVPAVPIGRLAAKSEYEVALYLDKVKEFEEAPVADWMKRILHFGGGANAQEQGQFAGYLKNFENTLEDTCFGGYVHTFLKKSSDPIQTSISDSVKHLINGGVSIMTFFGHASGTGFDQSLDEPENYTNKGKYPLLVGNSCFTGNIHQPGANSASEKFVLVQDKGVIGFLASVTLGLAPYLNIYSNDLFKQIGQKNYGKSIGICMKSTIRNIQPLNPDFFIDATTFSMTLHGDPSLVLNSPSKPDIKISNEEIFITPKTISVNTDSLNVNIVITNSGKATNKSFFVEVFRKYPSGVDSIYSKKVDGMRFKDTLIVKIPVDHANATGLNQLVINADYTSIIEEFNESNNFASKSILISTGGLTPISPIEYGLVGDSIIELIATNGNFLSPQSNYEIKIDTSPKFDSPLNILEKVSQSGGTLKWRPKINEGTPLEFTEGETYYWGVKGDENWKYSSFTYKKNKFGWTQQDFAQIKNNKFKLIDIDTIGEKLSFKPTQKNLSCKVYGGAGNNDEFFGTGWKMDLELQESNGCQPTPAIHVAVIDSVTLEAWGTYGTVPGDPNVLINQENQFGNYNSYQNKVPCLKRSMKNFNFWQYKSEQMEALNEFLNFVPDNNYFLIYTFIYTDYDLWENKTELAQTFKSLGADSIGFGRNKVPFIFFVKKGHPETAQEVYGEESRDIINFSVNLKSNFNFGSFETPLIGPSQKWNSLSFDFESIDPSLQDSTILFVYGIDKNGTEVVLEELKVKNDTLIPLDHHSANTYKYLKLKTDLYDNHFFTPSQLKNWVVDFTPSPEFGFNGSEGLSFYNDTLQQGEKGKIVLSIENYGSENSDSLPLTFWIEDPFRKIIPIENHLLGAVKSKGVSKDSLLFSTLNLKGENKLWIEINPPDSLTNSRKIQENYYFNNLMEVPFVVAEDIVNPILDVTFDGVRIMNGEIISSTPKILISLIDENPYLIMSEDSDTSNFDIFLTHPSGQTEKMMFNGVPGKYDLNWFPANEKNNKFLITFSPTFEVDGKYGLYVQAKDKSGNLSGNNAYQISFEVITKSTITEVFNYPNPFSTSTRFLFTLTGSLIPDFFRIKIMTITGKVVREIDLNEFGPIRIGKNISTFSWDGRDQYGDPLANGLYLYQVRALINGNPIEYRQQSTQNFFRKRVGKMYLMR